MGSGTRAGAALGRGFGFELDWARQIFESGSILGTHCMAVLGMQRLVNILPKFDTEFLSSHLPLGASAPVILVGILGQPTNLGFAVFGCGLCLAACKK